MIFVSERNIAIRTSAIYCDGCQASVNLLGELNNVRLTKLSDKPSGFTSGDGLFIVDGLPADETTAMAAMVTRGWKVENIHGKSMLFCPQCLMKGGDSIS